MIKSKLSHPVRLLLAALAVGALTVLPLQADTVFVGAYTGSSLTLCDPVCNNPLSATGVSISTFGSTAVASPPGMPSRTKCTYFYYTPSSPVVVWSVKPPTTADGGIYKIEIAHNATSSCMADAVMTIWSNDGVCSSGCTNTTVFDKAHGGDAWQTVGYITNNPGVTSPTIYFQYVSGTLSVPPATGSRIYIDAHKFTLQDPCAGYVGDVVPTGPLAAGQDFVNVTGVTVGATNVTIYANDVELTQTNYAAGFAAGALTVPLPTTLVKDQVVKATQSKPNAASPSGFCTSTYPQTGAVVGGGANAALTAFLTCGTASGLTGPAGADTAGNTTVEYHVKCTGLVGAGGTAPVGGVALTPGSCWQTATFDIKNDPCRNHQGNVDYDEPNAFCEMIALSFSIDATALDSGPYDVYVDQIKNGDTIIENFEGWADGTGVMLNRPNVATIPPAGATYIGAPNSAVVSQLNAYDGTNSCRIQWQFLDNQNIRWARVIASRSNGATYPQLDTSKPVTVRYLLLPVGQTTGKLGVGTVPSQTKVVGQSVTFSVTATGDAPFSYQWKKNGSNVGTDSSSYTIGTVGLGDAGTYTVVVDNATCDPVESAPAILTVTAPPKSSVTISNIVKELNGTYTINFGGGEGASFTLLKSTFIGPQTPGFKDTWTPVGTDAPSTPGSFNITPALTETNLFFTIRSN